MLDGDESKVTVGQFELQNNLEEVKKKKSTNGPL